MPEGSGYGRHSFPSGFRHLGLMGPSKSNEAYFLYPMAWRSVSFIFEDFHGGGLLEGAVTDFEEGNWAAGNSANGTVFNILATQLASGVAQGVTGAATTDTTAIWGEDLWLGDQRCGMEMRYKLDDIDNQNMEVGFTDPLSDEKLVAIADIDAAGPSVENGAADVALIARQTGQTKKTLHFFTDGSTSNMNSTSTALGTRNHTNAIYTQARVQLDGDSAFGFVTDANSAIIEEAAHGALLANRIEGGTLVHARFCMEALTTSAITTDIDYVCVWQDRIA